MSYSALSPTLEDFGFHFIFFLFNYFFLDIIKIYLEHSPWFPTWLRRAIKKKPKEVNH